MIGETIHRLASTLDSTINAMPTGDRCLLSKNYKTYSFDKSNFRSINLAQSTRRVAFLDGGNQEIFRAPNLSIQLNRICFNMFQGKIRQVAKNMPMRVEFFSTTEAAVQNGYLQYKIRIFPVHEQLEKYLPRDEDLEFDTRKEAALKDRSMSMSKIASAARRFAEWSFALHVISEELSGSDVLVMDGSLQARYSQEIQYARNCHSLARQKGVIHSGLAKSSRLVTNSGMSLLGALRMMATDYGLDGAWYYRPIAESLTTHHAAEMLAVKLSDYSPRAFRYDIFDEQARNLSEKDLSEILTLLCEHSNDVTFPGYPYGLIDIDDQARVRDEEVETYRMMLLSEISRLGSWPKFLKEIQSLDAHDMLDFLKGGSL